MEAPNRGIPPATVLLPRHLCGEMEEVARELRHCSNSMEQLDDSTCLALQGRWNLTSARRMQQHQVKNLGVGSAQAELVHAERAVAPKKGTSAQSSAQPCPSNHGQSMAPPLELPYMPC